MNTNPSPMAGYVDSYDTPKDSTQRQITTALDHLNRAQERADKAFYVLAERLTPTLGPATPSDGGRALTTARESGSPLAEALWNAVTSLDALADQLTGLESRVEL